MSIKMVVCACIPAFNEESSIAAVVLKASQFADRVVVCDDGSGDLTAQIAARMGADVVKHDRNLGYGAAVRSLLLKAREVGADVAVTLDSDGQHNADEIPIVVRPILDGVADVSIGSRFVDQTSTMPNYRRRGNAAITWVTNALVDSEVKDTQSGFRAYSKKALNEVIPSEQGMGASTEILIKAKNAGLRMVEVKIAVSYDKSLDTSTHSPVYHALDVIGSTIKYASIRHPLLFYGVASLFFMAVGLVFGLWSLQIYVTQGRVLTTPALISIGTFLIGVVLASTAIILFVMISVLRERN